jgi:B-cell receptor-associated protein 31
LKRYLCGFTLFLSLILNRTHSFILDILKLESTVKELRATAGNGAKDRGTAEVIAKKNKEIEAIKAQAEGLAREYSELSDRYESLQKAGSKPDFKKDL